MDLQVQTDSTRTSDAQQAVATSLNQSLEQWSSTSFQSPISYEVLNVSSLVPTTVLTLIPQYTPSTYTKIYPELPSISEVASEPQPLQTSSSGSSEVHDQKTSPFPSNPQEVQQRNHYPTTDGEPLEEGSVGLILPKDLPDEETGAVIINAGVEKGVLIMSNTDSVSNQSCSNNMHTCGYSMVSFQEKIICGHLSNKHTFTM